MIGEIVEGGTLDAFVAKVVADAQAAAAKSTWKCGQCSRPTQPYVTDCDACVAKAADRRASERRQRTTETIPKHYQWATFGAGELLARVRPQDPTRLRAQQAIDRTMGFVNETTVLFQGGPGQGKTSLAVALLRAAAEHRGVVGVFVDSRRLVDAKTGHRFGAPVPEMVRLAKTAGVLLLDELGAERPGVDIVGDILHDRHMDERPSIYTTGLKLDDIGARYGGGIRRRAVKFTQFVALRGDAQ